MKTIISAIIVAGALSQIANAMGPMGDNTHRHFYKDQEWIWQNGKSHTEVNLVKTTPQQFSEVRAWQAVLALTGALNPTPTSTPVLAFGLPTHPPAALAFGLPTHPPGALAFGLPTHPPGALAFGLPTHPPGALAFGLPTHPPGALAFGLPTHPPGALASSAPSRWLLAKNN
jgi:hypothetical protein